MGEVLFVSKPVGPPWNDSSKNLARDLASHLTSHRAHVLVPDGRRVALGGATIARLHLPPRLPGAARPAFVQARVLGRLLLGEATDVVHFFFAPNPRTSTAAAAALRLRPRPSVQTVCSAPRPGEALTQVLFAQRVVVLSRHTEARFLAGGVPRARLVHIPPCVPPLPAPGPAAVEAAFARRRIATTGPILVYPGDLEFSAGADRSLDVLFDLTAVAPDAQLVLACRMKTKRARVREAALAARAQAMGVASRVHFVGEVTDMPALLAGASVVLLPAETLYAKMDLPLVLLEAMQLGRAVVVLADTAAAELADAGAALAVPDDRDALRAQVGRLLAAPDRRASLGEVARRHVATAHSASAMARRYTLLYDELLGG